MGLTSHLASAGQQSTCRSGWPLGGLRFFQSRASALNGISCTFDPFSLNCHLSINITIAFSIRSCLSKRSRCGNRHLTTKEPWSWYSDLVHTPSELARVLAKLKSTTWTTTSSLSKSQARRTQHTTTYEACKGWVKSSSSLETSASSPSLHSSHLRLPHGRSVSSSSLRHSLMEVAQGSFGVPCGVGLASHRSI